MASIAKSVQLSTRIASRYASRNCRRRAFHMSSQDHAAQNYTMPALSPTMTEGNIASWRVKEGDSFSAGDVLLEIETDKATMDVEAQEDGILMKIVSGDGSKGIQVGARIGVTAEPGDDISNLEVPAEDKSANTSQKKEPKADELPKSAPKQDTTEAKQSQKTPDSQDISKSESKPKRQKLPLSAAVEALLHQNGLSAADADSIKATGPKGRLLKGDVLAHLGKIDKESPAKLEKHISKLTHLDLSNIQLAKKPEHEVKGVKAKEQTPEPEEPTATEVATAISLSSVIATQKRVQDTLGIFLPLSTFIARASELANDDLPLSQGTKPTADELFNAVLGLDKVSRSSRGNYFPHISGLSTASLGPAKSPKKPDIIDLLASKQVKSRSRPAPAIAAPGISPGANIFSVIVQNGEERRAEEYLGRMKLALEQDPGRLIL